MPDTLTKVPFTRDLLDLVADFDCGDEVWQTPLSDWIKGVGEDNVFEDLATRKNLEVWLYANQAGELVGYGSLGETRWQWPTPQSRRETVSVIPYVAVAKRFWGLPQADSGIERKTYAMLILDDLIAQAKKHCDRRPVLGLFVDPRNVRAIRAYEKVGFVRYFTKKWGDLEYEGMLLSWEAEEAAACPPKTE